jgi:hypothetical protein
LRNIFVLLLCHPGILKVGTVDDAPKTIDTQRVPAAVNEAFARVKTVEEDTPFRCWYQGIFRGSFPWWFVVM